MTALYFEVHVTLDPVAEADVPRLKDIATDHTFRVAELIKRNGSAHVDDSFITTRTQTYYEAERRTRNVVDALRRAKFHVRRYKIEFTLCDSNLGDSLHLGVP